MPGPTTDSTASRDPLVGLREARAEEREDASGVQAWLVPDASGGDPIPWEEPAPPAPGPPVDPF